MKDEYENKEFECNEDCENCPYNEEDDPEYNMLCDFTEELLNNDFCPNCGFDFVLRVFEAGQESGWDDGWNGHKQMMIDFLTEDED